MAKRKKSKHKLKFFILFMVSVVVLGIGGIFCYKYYFNDEKSDVDDYVDEPLKEPIKKVKVVDLESNSRPYAVMINNNSAVWKYQSGLNEAYVVYEMMVEGGITREMALYKDVDVEKIQSVRSARHYFLDYVLENDAIYVHWGWSPQAEKDIKSLKINNINGLTYENTYFFRDNTVKAAYEHKGYTKMSLLKSATSKLKYRSNTSEKVLLNYSVDPVDISSIEDENIEDANYVEIKFSSNHTSKFIYDEKAKVYKKFQNKVEMKDYTSGKPFTTKNIITYKLSYPAISEDNYGRVNLSNVGSGEGYYISEGKAVPITWSKTSRSAKTVYKFKNGEDLIVNDGNTYIELQPSNQKLILSSELPE